MKISRRNFLALAFMATGGSLVFASGYLYLNNEADQPIIKRVQIPIKNLKPALEGFTIALLGDFHLYPLTQIEVVQRT